jgi:hypothetical protein
VQPLARPAFEACINTRRQAGHCNQISEARFFHDCVAMTVRIGLACRLPAGVRPTRRL